MERERAGRCPCLLGHVDGLARSNRKNAGGDYFTEPGSNAALHFSDCPHSELARCTPKTLVLQKRRRRPITRHDS